MDEPTRLATAEARSPGGPAAQPGQMLPEYAIVVATVSIAAVGVLTLLGQSVLALYGRFAGLF
jgi:hypothetical protein